MNGDLSKLGSSDGNVRHFKPAIWATLNLEGCALVRYRQTWESDLPEFECCWHGDCLSKPLRESLSHVKHQRGINKLLLFFYMSSAHSPCPCFYFGFYFSNDPESTISTIFSSPMPHCWAIKVKRWRLVSDVPYQRSEYFSTLHQGVSAICWCYQPGGCYDFNIMVCPHTSRILQCPVLLCAMVATLVSGHLKPESILARGDWLQISGAEKRNVASFHWAVT